MSKQVWEWREAKNDLERIVEQAQSGLPQIVMRDGAELVVILSHVAYRELIKPKQSIVEFFRASPLVGADLNLDRTG